MLVGTPFPVNLSVFVALEPALWSRRAILDHSHAPIPLEQLHQNLPDPR